MSYREDSFRRITIAEIEKQLKKDILKYEYTNKCFKRTNNTLSHVTFFMFSACIAINTAGIVTIFGFPLEILGTSIGGVGLLFKFIAHFYSKKADKHNQKLHLSRSTYYTIQDLISKCLDDEFISDDEFKIINEVIKKYSEKKANISTTNLKFSKDIFKNK